MWLARKRVLVDETGTVSGGVDAQISVTASVDAAGYEDLSRLDPSLSGPCFSGCCSGRLLVAVALGLGWSPPVLPFVPFRFGGVQLKEEKSTDPRTGSDPKITFLIGIPSCFDVLVFGSLYQKPQVGGTIHC